VSVAEAAVRVPSGLRPLKGFALLPSRAAIMVVKKRNPATHTVMIIALFMFPSLFAFLLFV
jgi:hypothetical protein